MAETLHKKIRIRRYESDPWRCLKETWDSIWIQFFDARPDTALSKKISEIFLYR